MTRKKKAMTAKNLVVASCFSIVDGKPEITRLKGLGEISPNEFKQFIGKEMRLRCFRTGTRVDSQQILSFYMGKNTPRAGGLHHGEPCGDGGGVRFNDLSARGRTATWANSPQDRCKNRVRT